MGTHDSKRSDCGHVVIWMNTDGESYLMAARCRRADCSDCGGPRRKVMMEDARRHIGATEKVWVTILRHGSSDRGRQIATLRQRLRDRGQGTDYIAVTLDPSSTLVISNGDPSTKALRSSEHSPESALSLLDELTTDGWSTRSTSRGWHLSDAERRPRSEESTTTVIGVVATSKLVHTVEDVRALAKEERIDIEAIAVGRSPLLPDGDAEQLRRHLDLVKLDHLHGIRRHHGLGGGRFRRLGAVSDDSALSRGSTKGEIDRSDHPLATRTQPAVPGRVPREWV